MDYKKIRKSTARFLAWIALIACSLIIKIIPARCLYGFSRHIAYLGYMLVGKQRKIALDSLSIAFGKEKSPQEIEQIAKDSFSYMAQSAAETLSLLKRPQFAKENVDIEGRQHLENALSKGKGAILVSAHFGNFPILMAHLSITGYKILVIMRSMRDARTEKFFIKGREKLGLKIIYSQPRNVCVMESIRALRNNELVFILLDQNFGTGGVFVDFFGRKAATAAGPVVLARRSGAALLPCFIIRQEGGRHKIIFEPELKQVETGSAQETIILNVQRLTDIIESYIRKYPAEWGWIHRRWKSKMKPELTERK